MTVAIFYPDPYPTSTSVDGNASQYYNTEDAQPWAIIRAAAGAEADDTSNNYVELDQVDVNTFNILRRYFFLFDTSSLPDDAVITAATFSFCSGAKGDNANATTAQKRQVLCSSYPASNTAIIAADYDIVNFGTTEFGSIAYADVNTNGTTYNNISLNAPGIANISKTGISKFGVLMGADFDNSVISGGSGGVYIRYIVSETGGHTTGPKLTVTYGDTINFYGNIKV